MRDIDCHKNTYVHVCILYVVRIHRVQDSSHVNLEFVRDIVTSSVMIMRSIHTIQVRLSVRGREGSIRGRERERVHGT